MKKLLTPLVALAVAATALLGTSSAQAQAPVPAAAPVVPAPAFTPTTGVLFNDPTGDVAAQFTIMDNLTQTIDATPRGAVIRIAVYSFSYTPAADALIAAHKRGVQVRLLIDSHATTPEISRLKRELKTSKKRTSYVATCKYGCMSSKPSFMHAKIYMFSTSGKAKQVVQLGSANPAWGGGRNSWNNSYTIVGNAALYASNLKYFNDMLHDKTNTHYYRTTSSYPYKEYFYPRAGSTRNSDTLYNVLKDVKCTGAQAGYGNGQGHTMIRIAAYLWTTLRLGVAQKLTELSKQGCDIQIIYSADTIERPVAVELLKGKKIPVFNGRLDRNGDGVLDLYIHSKYLLISGVYGTATNAKVVFTGSPNFSGNSLRQSNETGLKIQLNPVYNAFLANFNQIRDGWTIPVTKAPKPDAKADARVRTLSGDQSLVNRDSRLSKDDYQVRSDDE